MSFEDQNKENFEFSDEERIELIGDAYLESFDLDWESLIGKKVLDIGGNDGSFAAAAKLHGVDVITVDYYPKLFAKKGISDKADYVGGDVYQLPFKDESFDFVCARYLTPYTNNLEYKENIQRYLKEVMRVVKPGGQFRVLPAPFRDIYEINASFPIERLWEMGYDVTISEDNNKDRYYIFTK